MKIQSVSNYITAPQFTANTESGKPDKKVIPENIEEKNKGYSGKQLSGAVVAAALSAAVLGGAVMHGKGQKVIRQLTSENSELQRSTSILQESIDDGVRQIEKLSTANKSLVNDNNSLKKINKELQDEIQKAKDKLQDLFEGDIAPKNVRDAIYNKYKTEINKGKLSYDVETPPISGRTMPTVYEDAIELPTVSGTTNRIGMRDLDIPEVSADGRFEYKLPTSAEMQITHMQSKDFKPVKNQLTNITESYADSVQWNNDKIARDVMQNFYDGHGQTLDGIQMTFEPAANGKYKVRIKGDSTYTVDKAVYIGESTKRDNAKAAGNYGEGLKMSVLKLLKDCGADEVKIGSDNWKLTYNLQKGDLSDKRVLAYSLDKVDKFNGNYIEFETSDKNLLETFRKTINRFYHSNNTHFRCPDFENDLIGVKLLKSGDKGGLYIAGQRFEFNNDFDGLNDIVIFIKEKPPVDILDPSRDRTSINSNQLENIAQWLARESRMPQEDKAKLLKALEPYWDKKSFSDDSPVDAFLTRFLLYAGGDFKGDLHIKFPSNYVAYSQSSNDVVRELRKNGYRVCKDYFSKLGMQTIHDLMGDARTHEIVIPDANQTKKILILKEALNSLSDSLKGKHFAPEELDAKIYLFNNKGDKDKKLYSDTMAEAIIDRGTSKGFWIDKDYLNNSKLSDILETALHELSHKAGGDETAEFSYKLTDVNSDAIGQILTDVQTRNKLQALNRLWDEISTNTVAIAA